MNKPHILFIIDYYHPHIGGLEIVFDNIIKRLLEQGYHIGILTTRHLATLPQYEKQDKLEIRRIGKNRKTFLFRALRQGRHLMSQFDIIHTTTYASAMPASLLGKRYKKKVILTIHEIFGPKLRKHYKPYCRKLYQRFEQMIFWFPYDHVICVSKHTRKMVRQLYLYNKKIHVIYNGIDTHIRSKKNKNSNIIEQFHDTHALENKFVALYYGHSGVSKGVEYLIQALPQIIKKNPDFKLILNLIPGKRDYTILQLIKQLQLHKHIVLLHGVQQEFLVNLVQLSNVVIVPSVSEGFGLVAAEVSALRHPLIVTKHASLPEVVSGKVVFLESYESQSFIQAIEKIKTKKRQKIPSKKFSWEETVEAYKRLY